MKKKAEKAKGGTSYQYIKANLPPSEQKGEGRRSSEGGRSLRKEMKRQAAKSRNGKPDAQTHHLFRKKKGKVSPEKEETNSLNTTRYEYVTIIYYVPSEGGLDPPKRRGGE